MWRLWVAVGWLVWLGMISASGAINYLAGYQFGRAGIEAHVFAILGVCADAWKAIGPIFILTLWLSKRRTVAGLAAGVWGACFVFAAVAALGLAAQNRSAVSGSRHSVTLSYDAAQKELSEAQRQRARIGDARSPSEIESAISVILARSIGDVGTVGSISRHCKKDHWRTRTACAEIAQLREHFAVAAEAHRLDERIEKLNRELSALRDHGGASDADPQAQLVSRLSLGRIAREDVGLGIVLLLVVMVELISAFAPVVLHEATRINRGLPLGATGRDLSRLVAAGRDETVMKPAAGTHRVLGGERRSRSRRCRSALSALCRLRRMVQRPPLPRFTERGFHDLLKRGRRRRFKGTGTA